MEELTKKDEHLDDVSEPRTSPFESVSWLSFDGKGGTSSHDFVRQVQRTAFQQGKQRDDEWVADFAATSFSGEALEWYVGLDEENQTSWRKLRAGLIQRWPINLGKKAGGQADLDPANIPTPAPAATPPYALSRTSPKTSLGRIKVKHDNGQEIGYLASDSEGRCIIQSDVGKALVVANPQQVHPEAPCRISIEGPEETKKWIEHMPYLGLSLLKQLGRNPDFVPSEIPYQTQGGQLYAGRPVPSGLCDQTGRSEGVHPFATWYISPCSRDPPGPWRERTSLEPSIPATAVLAWILDSVTLELTATWLMEDGTLDDVVACTDGLRDNIKLHMHRSSDVRVLKASRPLVMYEGRARLFFTPIQS